MPYLGNEVAPLVQALEGKELKLDADGDTSITADTDDQVILKTGNTTALTVDSSQNASFAGLVTSATVPSWRIALESNQSVTTTAETVVQWNVTDAIDRNIFLQNVTFSSSTYKVTVPVAGIYYVNFTVRADSIGSSHFQVKLRRNEISGDTTDAYALFGDVNYTLTLHGGGLFKCNANDTFKVLVATGADTSYAVQENSQWSGCLIG